MPKLALVLSLCVLLSGAATAAPPECGKKFETTTRTTFSAGNEAGWGFNPGSLYEVVSPKGGNPGAFRRNRFLSTAYPVARTEMGTTSVWTGDYAARGVSAIGVDFIAFRNNLGLFQERFVSVVLVNDSGTPEAFEDDCFVFFTSDQNIPDPTVTRQPRWEEYSFAIPSDSPPQPPPHQPHPPRAPGELCIESCPVLGEPCWGWSRDTLCPTKDDPQATWQNVITDVDQVWISWQHPEYFSLIQDWSIGMDNPAITTCAE
jgi:hypothetical protein